MSGTSAEASSAESQAPKRSSSSIEAPAVPGRGRRLHIVYKNCNTNLGIIYLFG